MTRIRFVHAADLHLDSPFTGIRSTAPENVGNALYAATFKAYENIIELCISKRVDALLVAGDIFDGADRSLRAQRGFIEGLERLDDAGIRSFVCHGNHDPLDGWEAKLTYPPSCHRFGGEWESVPVFDDAPDRAVVYGISYPQREVKRNLARRLRDIDPEPFSIGLLHANVGGDPNHEPYAPCALDDLVQSDVNYWALGHVHTRRVLHDQAPTVVYPGNPQGRSPSETGARGVYLVEIDDSSTANPHFRPMDTVRWKRPEIDISEFETEQQLLDALHARMQGLLQCSQGRSVVACMTLTGRGTLNRSLHRPNAIDALCEIVNDEWVKQSPFGWCERIENASASQFDRTARLQGSDFLAEVLRTADRAKATPGLPNRLDAELSELYGHHRFRRYLKGAAPDENELSSLIDEAEAIVINSLVEDGDV